MRKRTEDRSQRTEILLKCSAGLQPCLVNIKETAMKKHIQILVLLFTVSTLFALINPNFTPVHLTQQSTTILYFTAGAPEDGIIPVSNITALKGSVPESIGLVLLNDTIEGYIEEKAVFDGVDSVNAMIFLSIQKDKDGSEKKTGSLNMDGIWFELKIGKGNSWEVTQDPGNMKLATWNGHVEMLKRCVEYVMKDEDPSVPVASGMKWGKEVKIGEVKGTVSGCAVTEGISKGKLIFCFSAEGDRAFGQDGKGGWMDMSSELGLESASESAVFCDFNGDGNIDLVSLKKGTIQIYLQNEKGTFAGKPLTDPVRETVKSVCVSGNKTLILGGPGVPVRCSLGKGTELCLEPVYALPEGEEFPGEEMGEFTAVLCGDFDNDGLCDIVQAFSENGLFYKGNIDGSYNAPKECGYLYAGTGETKAYTADLDQDGNLDILFMGDEGYFQWGGKGDGTFSLRYRQGEADYIAKQNCSGGAAADFTNDGREEFIIFYKGAAPHPFFNRGFTSLGFAGKLDLTETSFSQVSSGQQAGTFADLTGDGYLDLVAVLKDGSVWMVPLKGEEEKGLTAEITLSPEACKQGPVSVTGWIFERRTGIQNLRPGMTVTFSSREPGPITLKFRFPGGKQMEAEVVVEDGPVCYSLTPEGLRLK